MSALREAEQAVLSAAIQSPVALDAVRQRIVASDFYHPEHEAIWNAILTLRKHRKEVGWITVHHLLDADASAKRTITELIGLPVVPEHAGDYADMVRDKATLRRLHTEAVRVAQITDPLRDRDDVTGRGMAAQTATRFAEIRDSGITAEEVDALTMSELMTSADEPHDWLIPNLLERRDRLMLTGEEGLGKSHLLRQIAMFAAAGLHPFRRERIDPVKTVIVDCENTQRQVRRASRIIYDAARGLGEDPGGRVVVDFAGRMDLTADKHLARVHHLLDACEPDMVIIGPLYRLSPRAIQTDDEAAPILSALDTIRDRGIALLIEAHAGHALGKTGSRDLRPRGSSALLGWPEFGYGMRTLDEFTCELVPWRGDRDHRQWPDELQRDVGSGRWLPVRGLEVVS